MSRLLCQQENGIYFLCLVLMQKDRIEDSLHACSVTECPHRSRPSPHLLKSSFNVVCCPYTLPKYRVREEKACEEIVYIIKETLHGQGIPILPSFLPSSRPLSRLNYLFFMILDKYAPFCVTHKEA